MANNIGDALIEKVGGHGRYQIFLVAILLILGTCNDFYLFYLPLMETPPVVTITRDGKAQDVTLTYNICDGKEGDYTINEKKTKDTFSYTFDFSCSKVKVTLLGSIFCLGSLCGAYLLRYLKRMGSKNMLFLSGTAHIITTGLLYIKVYEMLAINCFLFGFNYMVIYLVKKTIISELTDEKYRAYFINVDISSGITSSLIFYFTFSKNFNYEWVYSINALVIIATMVMIFFYYYENPRFFLEKGDNEGVIQSLKWIARINKVQFEESAILQKLQEKDSLLESPKDISQEKEKEENGDLQIVPVKQHFWTAKRVTLWKCFITFVIYVLPTISAAFEIKNYGNDISDLMFYLVCVAQVPTYYIMSILMNLKILGRRFSVVIFLCLILSLRIVKIFFPKIVLIFLIIRLLLYTTQIPMHTLMLESFSTKERMKNYGTIYIGGKVAALFAPFLLEMIPAEAYNYIMMGFAVTSIFLLFILKETLNRSLDDN
jgi:hypothetical protein